jgi:hypothetical protein
VAEQKSQSERSRPKSNVDVVVPMADIPDDDESMSDKPVTTKAIMEKLSKEYQARKNK